MAAGHRKRTADTCAVGVDRLTVELCGRRKGDNYGRSRSIGGRIGEADLRREDAKKRCRIVSCGVDDVYDIQRRSSRKERSLIHNCMSPL